MTRIKNVIVKFTGVIVVSIMVVLCSIPVIAASSVDITITLTPRFSNGIANFTITYVNDNRLNFDWDYDTVSNPNVKNIMIRGKGGAYPLDIVNVNIAPTDGYLVYYGNGTSATDTSMDFNNSTIELYYSAYAQNDDGTWTHLQENSKGMQESAELILIAFIVLVIGLIIANVAVRNSFIPIKVIAAMFWAVPFIWIKDNPPSFMTEGSNVQVAFMVVIAGAFLICFIAAFRQTLQMSNSYQDIYGKTHMSGNESGTWHLPDFIKSEDGQREIIKQRKQQELDDYSRQVYDLLHPKRNGNRTR